MLGYSGYSFNRACNWLLKPNISEAVEYLKQTSVYKDLNLYHAGN